MYKNRDPRANLLFCLNLYRCFDDLVAVAVVKLPPVFWKTQVMAFPRPRIKNFSGGANRLRRHRRWSKKVGRKVSNFRGGRLRELRP